MHRHSGCDGPRKRVLEMGTPAMGLFDRSGVAGVYNCISVTQCDGIRHDARRLKVYSMDLIVVILVVLAAVSYVVWTLRQRITGRKSCSSCPMKDSCVSGLPSDDQE